MEVRRPIDERETTSRTDSVVTGGHLICPGRFLAKNVIIFTCALFLKEFDIQVSTKRVEFSSRWYGFGTEMPKHAIAVRIKRKD
jgi:hypothetical protein